MSETVRAVESFAWEGGMVHDGTEFPADAEVVTRFPHFFALAVKVASEDGPELVADLVAPVKRVATRRKAASS